MRTAMTLKDRIILRRREDAFGHSSEKIIAAEKEVCASVSLPGLSFQASSESAGKRSDLTALVWRREFDGNAFTHAVTGGIEYRINGVGAGSNDLLVRLSLERTT